MATWKIRSEMQPAFDGAILNNQYVKGGIFIKKTKSLRNAIGLLYRVLTSDSTTLCYVENDNLLYKLVNNPVTASTTDSDWEVVNLSSSSLTPVGTWNADNTTPVLSDAGAAGREGEFYFVTGAPTSTDVTHAGLFGGNLTTVSDGMYIVSVGSAWIVVSNATTWDAMSKPQAIIDYVNGTVIDHEHEIEDVNGLESALADKYDLSSTADHTIDFNTVPDTAIVEVEFLKEHYYTKDDIDGLIIDISDGLTAFLEMTDTPDTYTGQGGKFVAVKSDVSGLEFVTPSFWKTSETTNLTDDVIINLGTDNTLDFTGDLTGSPDTDISSANFKIYRDGFHAYTVRSTGQVQSGFISGGTESNNLYFGPIGTVFMYTAAEEFDPTNTEFDYPSSMQYTGPGYMGYEENGSTINSIFIGSSGISVQTFSGGIVISNHTASGRALATMSAIPKLPHLPTGSLPDYTVFEGSLAYDSTLNVIKWYDGADWLPLGGISAAANGIDASTGTAKLGGVLTEETIIDLDGFVFGFKNPDTSDYLKFKTTSGPTIEIEMDGSGTHFGYGSIRLEQEGTTIGNLYVESGGNFEYGNIILKTHYSISEGVSEGNVKIDALRLFVNHLEAPTGETYMLTIDDTGEISSAVISGGGSVAATIEEVSTTTYEFVEEDNGKIKWFTHASGCATTIPTGLSSGWNTIGYRGDGAGVTTFASSGTLEGIADTLETEKTAATIVHRGSDIHVLLGPLGTLTGGGGVGTSSDTQVLFNDSDAVAGSANLIFDGTGITTKRVIVNSSASDSPLVIKDSSETDIFRVADPHHIILNVVDSVSETAGNDAEGDIYYRNATGYLVSLGIGNENDVLMTSADGVPVWAALSLTPPGSDTYLIFNDDGAFGADAGLKYDKVGRLFEVTGQSIYTADNTALDSVTTVIGLRHTVTGTPDVGIGTGIGFSTTSLAGTVLGGSLAIEATDVTASDEEFDFVVNLTKGGTPTEALRVKGSTANAITLYQVNAGSPYSLTGASTNRTIDLSGYTMDQLANLVCTLIEDIKQLNLLV